MLHKTQKAGGLQILCCYACGGLKVADYNFTLDAPAWGDHTSDFLKVGFGRVFPNVAKVGGLQSQGVKGGLRLGSDEIKL